MATKRAPKSGTKAPRRKPARKAQAKTEVPSDIEEVKVEEIELLRLQNAIYKRDAVRDELVKQFVINHPALVSAESELLKVGSAISDRYCEDGKYVVMGEMTPEGVLQRQPVPEQKTA